LQSAGRWPGATCAAWGRRAACCEPCCERSAAISAAIVPLVFLPPPLTNPTRDTTALTIVQVQPRPGDLPCYRTVDRRLWLGVRHTTLYDQLRALAEHWRAAKPNSDWAVIVDATEPLVRSLGAGLASFLGKALPDRVIPVVFSVETKSRLGWAFLGAVETGRYHDYSEDGEPDTRQFWHEVKHCQYEVIPGPGERIRWGVWQTPAYDGLIAHGHDDLLLSAALSTILDQQDWQATGTAEIVHRTDPLQEIDDSTW
jgi:hypothetical protein